MQRTAVKSGANTRGRGKYRKLTNAEADAILRKYAPHWVEHLRDVEVLRRVMFRVVHGGTYFK